MAATLPDWVLRRPVAHRGLHDATTPENTLAAVEAAIEADYAVEVDLQLTADGGLIVAHDSTLDRTTDQSGRIIERTTDELRGVPLKDCDETLSSLDDLLALVSGRAALFLEAKAPRDHVDKARMAAAIVKSLGRYSGAATVMTFDPDLLGILRRSLRDTPLGILAGGEGRHGSIVSRFGRNFMLHTVRTKPDFVSYCAEDLPHLGPARTRQRRPVLAWTVRSEQEAARLAPHVDQIIFENFRP